MKYALLIFTIFLSLQSFSQVWSHSRDWSGQDELNFQTWVQNQWQADIYARTQLPNGQKNPYYGLRADCADTVYSMRIIYSFENSLPFQMQDPSGGGGVISNQMKRFNGTSDPLQRFRQFLNYVWGVGSTASIPNDTYPVAISKSTVTSGGIIVTTHVNHHSWTIKNILPIGVPDLIFNSRVHKEGSFQLQERQSWPNPSWVFEGDFSPTSGAGLRYWKPTSSINKAAWQVPGYSEEQYRIPLKNWNSVVTAKLASSSEAPQAHLERLLKTVCEGFQSRISVVQDAVTELKKNTACYDDAKYDEFSTPSRDQRVFDDLMELRRVFEEILSKDPSQVSPELVTQLGKIYPYINSPAKIEAQKMGAQISSQHSLCQIQYAEGKKIDLAEAKRRMFAGLMSNNPMDGSAERWGEKRGPSELASRCPSWDLWSPSFGDDL